MRRMFLAMLALPFAGRLPRPALAQDAAMRKLTQAEAEYEPTPRDIRMCATCSLFVEPNACKVVEGEVSPEGFCRVFAFAD